MEVSGCSKQRSVLMVQLKDIKLDLWFKDAHENFDYDETFCPVVRFESLRTLVALVMENDLMINQMDVSHSDNSFFEW